MAYAKLSDLSAGMTVVTDEGFTCMSAGPKVVKATANGELYVDCRHGLHAIDSQEDEDGFLIGISLTETIQ